MKVKKMKQKSFSPISKSKVLKKAKSVPSLKRLEKRPVQEPDTSDSDGEGLTLDGELEEDQGKTLQEKKRAVKGDTSDEEDEDEDDDDSEEEDAAATGSKHKENLEKLKKSDPEFFKFLQEEEADLLKFEESDGEEDEEEEEEDEQIEKAKKSNIPKAKKDNSGRMIFDGNLLDYLQDVLEPEDEKGKQRVFRHEDLRLAVDAFNSCVARVGADMEAPKYVINEQKVFEATVRVCFQHLGDAFFLVLRGNAKKEDDIEESEAKIASRAKKSKCQGIIKQYLNGVLLFLAEVQSQAVIISTMRAISRLVGLYAQFSKMARNLIKALIRIWTRKTIECRVMAYVNMNKLLKEYPEHFAFMYKACYLGFVSNAREVTEETWPLLHFMHRTFAELTLLNPDGAYPYAFVYIRQTAIHLRNAMIAKKRKDLVQTVYNWQLVQCLYLWVRVVSKAHTVNGAESIAELTYPLTQIIIGVSRLFPSPRFLPLRFHCISLLIQLEASCTNYIPTLAYACDLLEELTTIFRKKPKLGKGAVKATDLDCAIKVGTLQLDEAGWRASACDRLFRLMLQSAHLMCNQAAFPDIVLPVSYRMRAFLKGMKSADHSRLFKGLLDKLQEHTKFVERALLVKDIDLNDELQVLSVKFTLNDPDSPLRVYYRQWEKIWKMKQNAQLKAEKAGTAIKKDSKKEKSGTKVTKDSIEDSDDEPVKPKKTKKKRAGPASTKADATLPDEVADMASWSDDD